MCKHPNETVRLKKAADPNDFLEQQVQKLIRKSKKSKDDDPALKFASNPKIYDGIVRAGTPIYVPRSRLPVLLLSSGSVFLIVSAIYKTNIAAFFCCIAASLIFYDLLSGLLHIVFDNPANLYIPILGQPCLEFQMHHHFPNDLVRRDFLDVLGDLNTAGILLTLLSISVSDVNNPVFRYMGGLKLFMAYYGQFSHRSAHTPSSSKNRVITALRTLGLMIPLEKHRVHHTPPHDQDFCLIGVLNPLINFLYHKVTKNRYFWMVAFFSYAALGIQIETIVMEKLLTNVGLL